jgi:hypothetical protein
MPAALGMNGVGPPMALAGPPLPPSASQYDPPPASPYDPAAASPYEPSYAAAERAGKMRDYDTLCQIISQWNANRLDLFALTLPNEVGLKCLIIYACQFQYGRRVFSFSYPSSPTKSFMKALLRASPLGIIES